MKNIIFISLTILIFAVISCSESEQDKQARVELSSIIRQLNANNQNLASSKKREESLNLLSMRGFYQDFIKGYESVRLEKSKVPITDKFLVLSNQLDTIIDLSIAKISTRQEILLKVSSIGSEGNSLTRNVENYYDYRREAITSSYSRDYYRDRATKTKIEIMQNKSTITIAIARFKSLKNQYDSLNEELMNASEELNKVSLNLDFTDSISLNLIALDTTDFLNDFDNQMTSFEQSIYDLKVD
ncbi:MAG: hypothetical protein RLQ12_01160 [Cyclobacteriaceae bacterium]